MWVLNGALSGLCFKAPTIPNHPPCVYLLGDAGHLKAPLTSFIYDQGQNQQGFEMSSMRLTHSHVSLVMINIDLFVWQFWGARLLYLRMNTANLFTSRPWPIAPFFSICKFYRISRAKFGHDIPTPVLFTDDRAFLCAKCTLVKNWSLPRIEAWLRGDGATLSWLRDSIDQQGMTKACTVRFLGE